MLMTLLITWAVIVSLVGLYLARIWWMERHPRYPVWPDDGPQTAFHDNDDFLGIGS